MFEYPIKNSFLFSPKLECSTIKATFDHEFGHQLDDWLKVSKQKNIQDLFDSLSCLLNSTSLARAFLSWDSPTEDFLQHDDIVRVQQRMIELAPELSDAKAGLASTTYFSFHF